MTTIETCDHIGCGKPAEYQVQFNDPWDFFFACREHLGSSIAEEFDAQAPDLKEFVVTRFTNHESPVTTP
jgi:hypothetical protein